jgi:hypothetical protein
MKWKIAELEAGDHIRVKRDYYYHHGVYIGNDTVVHFTGPENDSISKPNEVKVMKTSIDFFAKDGVVEKAFPSVAELFFVRNKKEAIKNAIQCIGNGNYDFLHNNCEDFANHCCYKKKLTSQIEKIKESI